MIKTGEKPHRRKNRIMQAAVEIDRLIPQKAVVLLTVLSAAVASDNMHLAALPLMVIQLSQHNSTKYICASVSLLFFVQTVTRTAFYIPCIAFVLVWLIVDYLLQDSGIKAVYPAVVAYAAAKAYVLSFGFDVYWWLIFVLETAAVTTGSDAVQAGFDILKNNDIELSAENLFEVACAMGTVSLAASAVQIWAFGMPVALLLSAAFFYGRKGNLVISLAAFAMTVLSLSAEENFALLAVGYAVIYLASVFMLSRGRWGYMGGIAVAFAVAMVTVSQFNSLVFVSVTAVSLTVAFVAEKTTGIKTHSRLTDTDTVGQVQAEAVMEKVDRLNRCFRFLGHTIIDISSLVGQDYIPPSVEDTVCSEVCRRCKNSTYCWQERYSDTQAQFSRCAAISAKGGEAVFDSWFYTQCDKTDRLAQAFTAANRLVSTQKLLHTAGTHSRQMLQSQFLAMADILRDITAGGVQAGGANTAFTHSAANFLALCGKKVDYCICYQHPDRCVVSTRDYMSQDEIFRFKSKLESIYNCRFADPDKKLTDGSMVYTFCSVPLFRAVYSTKTASRHGNCGDVCEIFTAEGYTYIILADGMGTGSFAAAESRTASAMLKSLLTSSVKGETAIEIVNIALNLKGTGQSCVALDILQVNLYDGSCVLYKAGGAATIAVSGGRVQTVYRDSLPVGILKETGIAQFSFTMNNGDVLIVTSDGVDMDDSLHRKLKLVADSISTEDICSIVMEYSTGQDDATVAVIRLERA